MKLTPDQKRILLVLCNAAERDTVGGDRVRLVCQSNAGANPIRETTTGAALVRKGLATRNNYDSTFSVTTEGFWMGDALRIEDRLGKIPSRRTKVTE